MKTDQIPGMNPIRGREVIHQQISTADLEPISKHPGLMVLTLVQPGDEKSMIVRESDRENIETMPDPFDLKSFHGNIPDGNLPKPFRFYPKGTPSSELMINHVSSKKTSRAALAGGDYPRESILSVSGWDFSVWHPDHETPRTNPSDLELWGSHYDLDHAGELLADHDWIREIKIVDNPIWENVEISGEQLLEAVVTPGQEWMDEINQEHVSKHSYREREVVTSHNLAASYQQASFQSIDRDPLNLKSSVLPKRSS